ncbi:outer membrane protein assembly factor BamB family protein [Candidatus Laterigemmans baculatus]|uniref:outer membrane protein assembly factor BamB family protein n=1 Tax=Candidatus Laterigemmans baculatus TaxID=2770505 RepID=UPI0013DC67CF|nr:PQQ-binding-like beta-propeller repeat protein [Candidatus Laterigemmans baculatus]
MNESSNFGSPSEKPPLADPPMQGTGQPARSEKFWGFYLAGLLILLMLLVQWVSVRTDHQMANLLSASLLLAATIAFLVAWMRRFRTARWLRFAPLLLLAGALLGAAATLEVTGVSGELIPQFAFRFRSQPAPPPAEDVRIAKLTIGPADFPGFLGAERDATVAERQFTLDWEQHPPRLRWKQSIGEGWSGFAIAGSAEAAEEGRGPYGFTLEQRDAREWVSCYDLSDGRLVWHHADRGQHYHALGGLGPRSTPTLSPDGRVYVQGATGIVRCLDSRDGTLLWRVDLTRLAGINQTISEVGVTWGRAASPLLVDDLVVLPLGGSEDHPEGVRSLIALDAESGETRWIGGEHQISYASPVLATLAGLRQILTVDEDAAAGHSPDDGRVLWTHPWPGSSNTNASCSNPTPVGDDAVLLSKGYGGGAMLLRLKKSPAASPTTSLAESELVAEPVWTNSRVLKTKFTNVCVAGDYAYALSDGSLECVHLLDGRSQWKQPRRGRYGHGHVLIVEDVLLVLSEEGELATVALDPSSYRELGRFQAIEGKTWNPPAVVGNLLVVRNALEAAVWEVAQISAPKDVIATGSRAAYGSP